MIVIISSAKASCSLSDEYYKTTHCDKTEKVVFLPCFSNITHWYEKIAALQDSGGRSKSDCILHREVEHF